MMSFVKDAILVIGVVNSSQSYATPSIQFIEFVLNDAAAIIEMHPKPSEKLKTGIYSKKVVAILMYN